MAKTIREEDLRLNVIVNGDPARKKILDLEQAVNSSRTAIRQMRNEQQMLAKQGATDSARYRELTKAIKDESAAMKQNKVAIDEARKKMSVSSMTIDELTRRAKQLRTALSMTVPGTSDWNNLNRELTETNLRLRELKGQSKNTGTSVNTIAAGISKGVAILGVALGIGRKVWHGLQGGVRTLASFEQANVNLSTILGKNVEDISELTNEALRLGEATRYTSSEVTGLQTELAKLGFTEREILSMGEPVLNFATAVGADLSEAAALAGAALRMFGLQADDTEDLLGAMAISTNKSALNFGYLQTAISIVGPVAKTFGFSVKDTVALLGTLANAGFDASMAATATRNIILNLANANGELAKSLGGPVKTFPELMAGLQQLNEKGIDLATTLELTDKRSVAAFNSFLNGASTAVVLRGELEDTDGVLKEIADKRMNTVEGAVLSLKSAWERFILSLRNNTGWIKDAILSVRDLVRSITPKDDAGASSEEIGRRTYDYVRGLWSLYEVDMAEGEKARAEAIDKISKAIIEDQAKIAEQLQSAEAKLATTSGSRNKRRWRAEVQRLRESYQVLAGANQELIDRQLWGQGVTTSAGSGGNGGVEDPDPNPKKKWSLQNDRAFLEAKVALTRQYNDGEIKDEETFNAKLRDLEIATLTARLAARKESGTDRLAIEQQLLDKVHSRQEDAAKREEKLAKDRASILADLETDKAKKARIQEDARYAEEQKKYQGNTEMLELIEKKHQQNMSKIAMDAQQDAMSKMQRDHEIQRAELENQWLDRIAQVKKGSNEERELRRQMNQELGAMDLEYLNSLHTLLEHIVSSGEFEGIAIPDEQLAAFKLKLQEVIGEITETSSALKGDQEGGPLSGTGSGAIFGVRQEQWDRFFDNLSRGKLGAADLGNALTAVGGFAQQGFQIARQAIAMTNAKEQEAFKAYKKSNDAKAAELQKRLDSGLLSQAQYDAEMEKMQAEQEEREEEMSLRQAEREKRMNIVQAIINTALAVTKTIADWGWPAGAVPASIVGAMGAAQVALMASTPVSGRERGGSFDQDGRPVRVQRRQDGRIFPARLDPDRRGYIDRPTVLVGESGSEYVVPNEALQNPSIVPFIDALETARRTGRLRDLRLEAVQPSIAMVGRAAGGFANTTAAGGEGVVMPDGSRWSVAEFRELLQLLRKMNVVFSRPITAEVSMLGRKGIVEKTNEYNRAKKGGQLNG